MADAVTTKVVFKGSKRYAVQLTNISDGTGEAAVVKVDISTLTLSTGVACTRFAIEEIQWDVQGFTEVQILAEHTTDDVMKLLSGRGAVSYRDIGYLFDPASAGGTGDLLLTTVGAVSGATYDITIVLQLR